MIPLGGLLENPVLDAGYNEYLRLSHECMKSAEQAAIAPQAQSVYIGLAQVYATYAVLERLKDMESQRYA